LYVIIEEYKVMKQFIELVEYALKAPSGHNTQPWRFRLTSKSIDIYPDFSRSLSVVDGNNRELYISLGTATENLCIAARHFGYKDSVSFLADINGEYYVHVELEKADKTYSDSLFEQIIKRQTNRRIYTNRPLTKDTLKVLRGVLLENGVHVHLYEKEDAEFNQLKEFVCRGNEMQMTDSAFKNELTSWIRLNKKQVLKYKDGLAYAVMGSPSVPSWIGKPIMNFMLTPGAQNKSDKKKIESSSLLALFTVENSTPLDWIALGRSLERFLLESTLLRVTNAYLNQPCEVSSLADEMRTKLDINGEHPMLLVRLGHAVSMPYSPRKEVNDMVFN